MEDNNYYYQQNIDHLPKNANSNDQLFSELNGMKRQIFVEDKKEPSKKIKKIKYKKITKKKLNCPNEFEDANCKVVCRNCNSIHLKNFRHQFIIPDKCPDGILCTNFFYDKCPYSHDVKEISLRGCKFGSKCRDYYCKRKHPQGTHRICRYGKECLKIKMGIHYDAKHVEGFLHPPEYMCHKNTPCKFGIYCQNINTGCEYYHENKKIKSEDEISYKYVKMTDKEGNEVYVQVPISNIMTINKKI